MTEPTPAERIAQKKRETILRKESTQREADWRAIISHVHGIMMILAQWNLGYKLDRRK